MNARVTPHGQIQHVNTILSDSQREDVNDALYRFFVQGEKGKLFTNGTGTGKTHLACGIINAFAALNRLTVLVVAPTDKILSDWQDSLVTHGHESSLITASTPAYDRQITLMTYASFRQCPQLLSLVFDLVVFDECHHLIMNSAGETTNGCDLMRALVGHPAGKYHRARLSGDKGTANGQILLNHALAFDRTKVLLLSATPFATHKCIELGEGLIFEYGPEPISGGYNTPSAKSQYFIDHFGYVMKSGRLQRPDAAVDLALMERRFHDHLVSTGALSYRALSVNADYSRHFISIQSGIGAKIDAGISALRAGNYAYLKTFGIGILNRIRQKQLLESIKARAAVERIQQHLALGRKVVVFHSYIQDSIQNPFLFDTDINAIEDDYSRGKAQCEYNSFAMDHPAAASLSVNSLKPAIQTLVAAFGDRLGVVNGTITKGKRRKVINEFNTSKGKIDVLIFQDKAGREGISLNDTRGDAPRVLIQLGLPSDPISCIQIEGRIRRFGSASNAIYEYFNTGTDFETSTFAQAIAERSELVENLACGNQARNLKANFVYGFLNSTDEPPSLEQGTGGLDSDTRRVVTSVWDQARSKFYSVMKKTARTKSAEGNDFFATPSPVGLFMAMLAKLKAGKSLLEPSAGLADIAAWCPSNVNLTCIERSHTLFQKLPLLLNRRATLHHQSFEDFHINTKFDAIVMNPPFGKGGKLAAEHVKKACLHARGLGRVIALIPESEQMDKRLDKLIRELKAEKCFMRLVQSFSLPTVTFERAYTSVKTRIVVLVRAPDSWSPILDAPTRCEDFSWCSTHEELFETLKEYADSNLANQEVQFSSGDLVKRPTVDNNSLPIVVVSTPPLVVAPLPVMKTRSESFSQLSLF